MPTRDRWLYAIKPKSWPKLLVPMLLGQSLGVVTQGAFRWEGLLWGLLFTIADGLFIVFLNDWSDRDVDTIKRRMFPHGCSPKTIPDGILPAWHVLLAGLSAGGAGLMIASASAWTMQTSTPFWCGLGCLALFWAYSLPPLRLNYRGFGELLEAFGVGVALPLMNAVLQGARLGEASTHIWLWSILPGFAWMCLASGVASGLSDEISDRRGGKRTFTTMLGNAMSRRLVEASFAIGVLLWFASAFFHPPLSFAVLPACVISAYLGLNLRRAGTFATTNAFDEQAAYKQVLHRAIWAGGCVASMALLGVYAAQEAFGVVGLVGR